MEKSLDRKLRAILADPASREFVLADAKDPDMAFGIPAPGPAGTHPDGRPRYKSLEQFREHIRELVRLELVDVMLMSASTSEALTLDERLFDGSPVTPAVRVNDTTDIHVVRGGRIHTAPSRPFRSATIDHVQAGRLDPTPEERTRGANLGLYSVTFVNRRDDDLVTLEAFREFREEAERKGFRYFLEVFDPNTPHAVQPELLPRFVNDMIARCLAGVTRAGRPLFLKMAYHGPRALEELVAYDPSLIVGILGGSAGTTRDAFQLLHDARKHGARIALFGRKINHAEHQPTFVRFLRRIADDEIAPDEAVRAYHAELRSLGLRPHRRLEDDLVVESPVLRS